MSLFTGVSSLNKRELIALIDSLSLVLADDLNDDDLNALGNLLAAISSVILTFTSSTAEQSKTVNK